MKKITSKDCVQCGLCCVAPAGQDVFCNIDTETELIQLGRYFTRKHVRYPSIFEQLTTALDGQLHPYALIKTKTREQKDGPFAGRELTTCVALKGDVGSHVSCSVYKNRPGVCHEVVKPGDRVCRKIRKEAGL